MGQHGADAARLGLEAVEAEERVEPDQPPAGAVQPVHLAGEVLDAVALQPVGDEEHDRPLPEHAARPLAVELAERRGDPRAARPVERPPPSIAASASSGSRRRSWRVTLVSRVPKRKALHPPLLAEGVEEMEEDARYRRSSSRRCRRARRSADGSRRGRRWRRRIRSPPVRRLARSVRRASMRARRRRGASSGASAPDRCGRRKPVDLPLGLGDLGRASSARNRAAAAPRGRRRRARASISISAALRAARRDGASNSASATRRGGRRRRRRLVVGVAARCREHPVELRPAAPEQAEGLVEDRVLVAPLHEDRMERPVEIARAWRCRRPRPRGSRRPPPPGRPAVRRGGARGRSARCCRRSCRLPSGDAGLGPHLLENGARALRRPIRAMSSWYLRSTPSVSDDGLRVERDLVELGERRRPVERLGDAGILEQVLAAEPLDEARRSRRDSRSPAPGTLVRTISSSRAKSG